MGGSGVSVIRGQSAVRGSGVSVIRGQSAVGGVERMETGFVHYWMKGLSEERRAGVIENGEESERQDKVERI